MTGDHNNTMTTRMTTGMTTRRGLGLYGLATALLTALLGMHEPISAETAVPTLLARKAHLEVCTGRDVPDGGGSDVVTALAAMPDGNHLLLGCRSGAVELRTLNGQLRFRQQPKPLQVQSVAVTSDGKLLFSLAGDSIHRWSSSGEPRGSFNTATGEAGRCEGCDTRVMVISPDGSSLLTGHADGSAALWNAEGVQLRRFEDPSSGSLVDQVAFDPSGSSIAIGEETGTVRRWNTTSGRLLSEIDTGLENLDALAITASGDVWAAGWYGAGRWDLLGRRQTTLRENAMVGYFQALPSGTAVVLGGAQYADNFFEIRDIRGQPVMNLRIHDEWAKEGNGLPSVTTKGGLVLVSADGRLLYMADGDWVYLWDLPENSP
ncbi:WD40 repeat domain-containing protein [Cyanobium sp. CH-040]|uniref:WD40 repeat domain-containing protein n=1 Tax=Cyanobium sp. CH-040 TaxID=2823708 RepID=UPI0020CC29E9|nr:hypothetical protein [Cyanobium sp. CH-040]MCP9927450.1 hypothetical protein [Cyanobium sp. CH-040]